MQMARRKSASRSSSPIMAMQQERNECCPVCYEEYRDVETAAHCVQLEACGHDVCSTCLHRHCSLFIQEHQKLPMTCPSCDKEMKRDEIHNALCPQEGEDIEKLWIKYQRRMEMLQDPSLVPCTKCQALISSKQDTTALKCPCGHEFCAIHGDAHPHKTCQEYEALPLSPQDTLSQSTLANTTKPCPHCHARIELYGGCEHIVCSSCNNDWCYKCGQYEYLVGTTIRTCTLCQQSYMDHRKLERQRIKACLKLPLTLPLAILYMLVAAASALASGCCCLFFGCGVFVGDDEELRLPPSPEKGVKMTLIYLIWPLLDILTDFGFPVYNGWLVTGIEQELGIANQEDPTVMSQGDDDDSILSNV